MAKTTKKAPAKKTAAKKAPAKKAVAKKTAAKKAPAKKAAAKSKKSEAVSGYGSGGVDMSASKISTPVTARWKFCTTSICVLAANNRYV